MTLKSKNLSRYAICLEDEAVLIVDAVDLNEALERAQQVRHVLVHEAVANHLDLVFTAPKMDEDEPSRVEYFCDGYFQLFSQTRH